jgi:hypothetical protein
MSDSEKISLRDVLEEKLPSVGLLDKDGNRITEIKPIEWGHDVHFSASDRDYAEATFIGYFDHDGDLVVKQLLIDLEGFHDLALRLD